MLYLCISHKKELERRKEEGLKKRWEERDAVFPICCICVFLQKELGEAEEEEGLKWRGEERDAVWQPVG